MTRIKSLFAVLAIAATVAVVPVANAQTVHYIGGGSSAMFQGFGVAAYNDLALGADGSGVCVAGKLTVVTANAPAGAAVNDACTNHHWTTKASSGQAFAKDSRGVIPNETGNLWVVWVTDTALAAPNTTDVWAYLQLDSAVGVRVFMANPRGTLNLNVPGAGANVISKAFFSDGSLDAAALPADVIAALNSAVFTAGMTDIRPEDALLATQRILGSAPAAPSNTDTIPTTANSWIYAFSLGYGPGNIGAPIHSGEGSSGATANPVAFALPGGNDPFSGNPVSGTIEVFPVGEAPIVVVANRQNTTTGLGQAWTAATTACSAAPEGPAGCTAVSHPADNSYAFRNVWSQHPFPAVANTFPNLNPQAAPSYCSATGAGTGAAAGLCHGPRRPLGSLFAGFDCETDSSAFTWPLDPATQGLRNVPPNGAASAITLFLREPLSGTYNTFEYDEVRIYGTPGGSQGGNGSGKFEATPYISQETNVVPPPAGADNPLNKQCPLKYVGPGDPADPGEGFRIRGIGTGEVISGPNGALDGTSGHGVLNTKDSIAYTFFSFGNVKNISFQQGWGYLMIDGVDPLFTAYSGSGGEPGQPVNFLGGGVKLNYGLLPACGTAGQPACLATAIWGGAPGSSPTYPHLRDGTYPAWSELRLICDPADPLLTFHNCTTLNDAFGAEALVENLQTDIHFSHVGGVPDLLPFNDGPGVAGFPNPYGDVSFIRSHYNAFVPMDVDNAFGQGGNSNPPLGPGPWQRTMWSSTRQGGNQTGAGLPSDPANYISFGLEACNVGPAVPPVPGAAGTPVNGPPNAECGGDAGGFILPTGSAVIENLQ